jgi:colicin import membrane protein
MAPRSTAPALPAEIQQHDPETAETTVLSRWDALAAQLAEIAQRDEGMEYDYANKHDQMAARSWIAQLRKVKASVERCRKDAKAVHLERGRAVDANAKVLAESVEALIQRHAEPIAALEAAEDARVAAHRETISRIELLAQGFYIAPSMAGLSLEVLTAEGIHAMPRVETSEQAGHALEQLAAIDTAALEEFQAEAEAAILQARPEMERRLADLQQKEAEAAELAALRAAAAEREREDREREIREQAIAAERQAAVEREQRAERERQAAAERAEQERVAAEQRAAAAEQRARELEAQEAQRREIAEREAAKHAAQAAEARRKAEETRDLLAQQLAQACVHHGRGSAIGQAIVEGRFHPALEVRWEMVDPSWRPVADG